MSIEIEYKANGTAHDFNNHVEVDEIIITIKKSVDNTALDQLTVFCEKYLEK